MADKGTILSVRLKPETKRRLKTFAKGERRHPSELVRLWIEDRVDQKQSAGK